MRREDFPFHHIIKVRYSEIDAQGVLYNAHYLTYFDTAIFEYFCSIGYNQFTEAKVSGHDFHTVRALVEYRSPIHFDEAVEIGVRIDRIGTASVTLALGAFVAAGPEPRASGEVVWVYVDQGTRRAVPVPSALRRKMIDGDPHRSSGPDRPSDQAQE